MARDTCEITLFTAPRAFVGSVGAAQYRAIESWVRLGPSCEVLLLGAEDGIARAAHDFGLRHLEDIDRNEFGTPLVNSIFRSAADASSGKLLCYINSDIILTRTFTESVFHVQSAMKQKAFLMIGRRWDIEPHHVPDMQSGEWEETLQQNVHTFGRLHEPTGIDYFIHTRGLWPHIPPFALGRWVWDNWLVYAARAAHAPVIDATNTIFAVHQNHGYEHHAGINASPLDKPEARRNLELAGGYRFTFNIADCSHRLANDGISPRGLREQGAARVLQRATALHPQVAIPIRLALRMSRMFSVPQRDFGSRR